MGTVLWQDGPSTTVIVKRLLECSATWQICESATSQLILLLQPGNEPVWWAAERQALQAAGCDLKSFDGMPWLLLDAGDRPHTLGALALRSSALGGAQAEVLARALAALHRRCPEAGWSTALFLPTHGVALASELAPDDDRRGALVAALSGGVHDATLTPLQIAALNPRLSTAAIAHLLKAAGDPTPVRPSAPAPEGFILPGQPALEALLREQVIDVLHRPAAYARLGVPAPGGVLLAGPPGCGKSFAAGQLARFLGWPLHEISLATVGSMWLHETSRKMADAFASAAAEAPAVILLEELDALGKSRASGFGPTADEVATLLRLIETAPSRGLLVIGTTNRPEAIDPALRRRGRFDIVHILDHADAVAMQAVLENLLGDRPHAAGLDLTAAARRLARRPTSDAVWVVNEAARQAVRGGYDAIDDLLLARALASLGATDSRTH